MARSAAPLQLSKHSRAFLQSLQGQRLHQRTVFYVQGEFLEQINENHDFIAADLIFNKKIIMWTEKSLKKTILSI